MRSRVVAAVLVGLGVLAMVFAGGLAFVVGPRVERLPYDMAVAQSVAEAPNARFLQIKNGAATVESGTLRSTVRVQPDAKATADLEGPLDGTAMVWLVGQEVIRTDTKDLVSAYSTALAVDRNTGAAQPWNKAWLDTGDRQNVTYTGHMYKFPFGTEKKSYEIFDRDLLAAQPAKFVKTEEIEGLETYQFTQEIRDGRQQLPTDRMQALLSQLLPGSTSGEVVYNNTRTVWVEPTTGQFIKVQEQQKKDLVGANGQSVTILDATFTYTDDTIKNAAETSGANSGRLKLVTVYAPVGLLVLGLLLIAAGIVLAVRNPRPAGVAAVPAQRRRNARHAASAPSAPEAEQSSADTERTVEQAAQKSSTKAE
jgi:hypothetical protein